MSATSKLSFTSPTSQTKGGVLRAAAAAAAAAAVFCIISRSPNFSVTGTTSSNRSSPD